MVTGQDQLISQNCKGMPILYYVGCLKLNSGGIKKGILDQSWTAAKFSAWYLKAYNENILKKYFE